jgi:aminoglycoside phosphotransferase (APT) family kinase protein
VLLLEAMTGARWTDLTGGRAVDALRRLGRAIAAVHRIEPPSGSGPFGRLSLDRIVHSAELVGRARPDVARRVDLLASRLQERAPTTARRVLLHGDCHHKNSLATDDGIAILDLDQAGIGDPAADIGSLLARLRLGVIVGERDAIVSGAMEAGFLDGYATLGSLPSNESLRWHTAAAIVAERMMRAVNRVQRPALARLDELLSAGEHELRIRSVA